MVMLVADGSFVLSPSDLTASAGCEFAWLRTVDVRRGLVTPPSSEADLMMDRLSELGDEHERRYVELLRSEGRNVVEIAHPEPYNPTTLAAAMEETLDALRAGVEVVAQAVLTDGGFGGQADFLVRDADGRYEVWDAKLARHAKVTALLQIAGYADLLDQHGIPRSPVGRLILGNGEVHDQDLDDVVAVYRHRRRNLEALLRRHLDSGNPARWNAADIRQCGSCEHCTAEVEAHRDLLLVAGMRRSQREYLRAAGVETIDQLAAMDATVAGLAERSWQKLQSQAALQVAASSADGVVHQVFDSTPIRQLPAPSAGDIFFDFEGDPLWVDGTSHETGLEYLFGWVADDGTADGAFTSLWADDRAEEKAALIAFLDFLEDRWTQHPDLHVYHYAPYEVTALKRLTVRHTVGEDFLDELLRAGVFIDLYATVRQSVRVSQPSYSIKYLEPLYMGESLRGEVSNATDSIVQYEHYRVLRADGDDEKAQQVRANVEAYNAYDCTSTMRLLGWLRDVGGWSPAAHDQASRTTDDESAARQTTLGDAAVVAAELLANLPDADRTAEQQAVALLAAALGYHRREKKPSWWVYYSRLSEPVDEWMDLRSTLVAEGPVELVEDWAPVKNSVGRVLRMRGRLEPGSTVDTNASVSLLFEDLPPGVELGDGEVRAYVGKAEVIAVEEGDDGVADVLLMHKHGQDAPTFSQLPMAAVEQGFVPDGPLEKVIQALATSIDPSDPVPLPATAALDVLARRSPRLVDGTFVGGQATSSDIDLMLDSIRRLDHSYLAVQGPPGTGKTYLGSHVVRRLVETGWKVGVVAQGHTTVETFLQKTIDAGLVPSSIAKENKGSDKTDKPWTVLKDKPAHVTFVAEQDAGFLVGGTAWAFASDKAFHDAELDLLVIDEAGQFSLANTIVVGRATKRLLLLGDPQQLPQVSQGTHPEPVDGSALAWLTEGSATMPTERGFFLAKTRRMHPILTTAVSRLSYEGRLTSVAEVTTDRDLPGLHPGIHPIQVEHVGNSVHAVEEADAILASICELMRLRWQPSRSWGARPMVPQDVIVVAPYNSQVAIIRQRLDSVQLFDTRVGTVDKFQGQEAPVVMVSMTASSPADAPRGMDFLLNRNRLNVAISRGQWAAYVFHSPQLADHLPSTPAGLAELGSYLRFIAD
ncbi:bifunctional RecB family nuclease/DEAD/DEAH box helicase [Aeromicrobium sp. 50.2.37]|uniref:TM0106 family RecB-like putative nuclease n=1 Tax=Aeromicrobium sp. 50.2.37 TaxID=2969305 RepID=UPI00214FA624|nr:bifunctional RecB family nuclease/DEAD/DEAH box helicase [Aeromicrobium sp. 50.2.37]MCR4511757.1 TM0106 family RecB-like putative nuclease [Aeromicrobium sp. 50.2.37]